MLDQIAKHLKLKKKMCSCMTKNYTGKLTSFTTYAMYVKKRMHKSERFKLTHWIISSNILNGLNKYRINFFIIIFNLTFF